MPIETLGVALSKMLVETIIDPRRGDHMWLHRWTGSRAITTNKLEHRGLVYTPTPLAKGLKQLVRFAPPSLPYGSTAKLVSALRKFLLKYASLQPEECNLLLAFALASWFCDCIMVAPVLYLSGPDEAVRILLRLLGCICRRPVLLGDIDLGGLAALPNGLGATLLLNQKELGKRVRQVLLASTQRHFGVLRGAGRLDAYGARAFSCEDFSPKEPGIMVSLIPAQDTHPFLSDADEQRIAQCLQAKLLRYRMDRYQRVRDCMVGCEEFVPELRQVVHSWLAPVYDCPELSNAVRAEFLQQSRELAGDRLVDPKCLFIEAALFYCHKPDTSHFFVGEVAQKANDLLKGRHEDLKLSAKKAGSDLRKLRVRGDRQAKGYKIDLTAAVRARIHRLAATHQVASVQDGKRRCRFCSGDKEASKKIR